MGVTIHWEGSTEQQHIAIAVVHFAIKFAEALGWQCETFNEKGYAGKSRIYDTEGKLKYEWLTYDKQKEWAGCDHEPSDCFGVVINPSDPFNTESIVIKFFRYKGKWHIKDFCKTQVFRTEEAPNLFAHIILDSMLLTIKHTWIPDLEISDEGNWVLPLTRQEREAYAAKNITEAYRQKYIERQPFNFGELTKAHGANLKLINSMSDELKKMGYETATPAEGQTALDKFQDEVKP